VSPNAERSLWSRLLPLLSLRAVVAVFLVLGLAPVCVDDYFRVFHAAWWWEHVSFTSSYEWTPGYTYVYGPAVGLFGDLVFAPRALTAALQLVTGLLMGLVPGATRNARLLAVGLFLFSPLSLVLGTAPLTESLFVCLLVGGAIALLRYVDTGDARLALVAAVLYLAATTVRYEGFAFAAVFSVLVAARRPEGVARWIGISVAVVPWIFPTVWTALLWASTGVPLSYLGNVRADHFGSGDVVGAIASTEGAVTALVAAAALVVSAVRVASAAVRGGLGRSVFEIHVVASAFIAAAAIATDNAPSQYPLRVLFPTIAFGALPLAETVLAGLAARRRAAGLAIVGAALSFAAAGTAVAGQAPGVPAEDLAAAAEIRAGFARGDLRDGDHVVVQHDLPSAAAVFVFANLPDRVHIDALGDTCAPQMLTALTSICPDPEWVRRVRVAVVRAGWSDERYVRSLGWAPAGRAGAWRLYVRPPGGPDLTRGRIP
jgi:hypothetical protein